MKPLLILILSALILSACSSPILKHTEKGIGEADRSQQKTNESKETKKSEKEDSSDQTTTAGVDKQTDTSKNAKPVNLAPKYRINDKNWSIQPIGDAEPKAVLLTIDDAPDHYALQMAKTLKKLNVNAIFFVNGHFLQTPEKKRILKEIYDMGFMIGNHTYSHSNLNDLTPAKQKEEILSVNRLVQQITGEKPKFFRAPFGENTEVSRKIAAEEKMKLMNWSYGYDWVKQYEDEKKIADIMVNSPYLYNGANLLMHDREWTNAALEKIVEGLRSKGYKIIDPRSIETYDNQSKENS
ncbi:polysaccharide deacetylase family protein [Falsibacillus albus]|uniref:Polysaccharide deacetylase family protein n=1 Tax=Falsibacillus albus TaxID=2478915 RepID=A0A3L7JYW8_9BACI|nr:polysaccharide deacetylase family protein [Falsibacillus albus]RLQ95906.1 polysaccharide deacetylase family protein [Falsibacillus albus]